MNRFRELSRWQQISDEAGSAVWSVLVIVGVGLVAYADWQIEESISLGYFYLFPLVLAGITIRHRGQLASFVVMAATLREGLGPFEHGGSALVIRSGVVLLSYTLVVFYVSRLRDRQRRLAEVVDQQRDQLTRDLEEAAALQRLLIPSRLPDVPGWDLSAKLYPARVVAGDFFDVFWNESSGRLGLVVADVAGKGAAAAMLMPVVQATVRQLRLRGAACSDLAASLNAVVVGLTNRPRFVSLAYLDIDTHTGDIEYVNMGHPPPALIRSHPELPSEWLDLGGPVAGAVSEARYDTGRERLEPGDMLLLYTDGASEAEDAHAEPFSENRLVVVGSHNRTRSADATIEAVHTAVEEFRADPANRDDMTLMVIRRDRAEREPAD